MKNILSMYMKDKSKYEDTLGKAKWENLPYSKHYRCDEEQAWVAVRGLSER